MPNDDPMLLYMTYLHENANSIQNIYSENKLNLSTDIHIDMSTPPPIILRQVFNYAM